MANERQDERGALAMPEPIGNLVRRFMQLAVWSEYGRAYPVYGGWALVGGELRLTVFGPHGVKDAELLGRFNREGTHDD